MEAKRCQACGKEYEQGSRNSNQYAESKFCSLACSGSSRKNTIDVVMAKVAKSQSPDGCWYWLGYTVKGYGVVRFDGKDVMAHRFFWGLEHGEIPDGMYLDHLCRNPRCVNPSHLRLATPRENTLAPHSRALPAMYAARTHCPKCGDEFFIQKDGSKIRRRCRRCLNERQNKASRKRWAASDSMRDRQRERRASAAATRSQV